MVHLIGCLYLHGYKVQSCTLVGRKDTFELIPPPGGQGLKSFIFGAKDDTDKKR